jgi:hypothetical protein
MYLLYLDDSGSPSDANQEYFVLGGIALHEGNARWLSHEIELLAEYIDPANPTQIEFHAAELFNSKNPPWSGRSRQERIQIMQNVLRTLNRANPTIAAFACAVHKPSFPGKDPVLIAYEDISSRFDMFIQRNSTEENSQKGIIILDKSSSETGLQTLAVNIRRTGNRWGGQLRRIIEVPLFVDSRASRITQLADHIAYAVFRRYNANDLTYFNVIENRFDTRDGNICGLVHKHSLPRACTCPACLSRR